MFFFKTHIFKKETQYSANIVYCAKENINIMYVPMMLLNVPYLYFGTEFFSIIHTQ